MEYSKMNYKELILEAKKRGIIYAWREGRKTVWKEKNKLAAEIAAALPLPDATPAPEPMPDTPEDNPWREEEAPTAAAPQAEAKKPKIKTATTTEEKSNMGTLEKAIMELIGKDVNTRVEAVEKIARTALETVQSSNTYRGVEIKAPQKINRIEGLTHEAFDHVLRLATQRQNILLVGPAGTGKTHLAAQIAEALGLAFAFISASAGMSEAALEGHLLPVGEAGRFDYCPSQFVNMYENGGVFLIDELDSADANLMTIINSALANGHMAVNKRFDSPVAKRHADFVCIAAANTFGHGANRTYAGRQQLDAATLDRFRSGVVFVDYDARIEEKTVEPSLLKWGRATRAKIESHGLRRIMSTRFLKNYSMMMAAYPAHYGLETAKDTYFADWSVDEKAKVS